MKQNTDHLPSFRDILLKIKLDIYIYNWALDPFLFESTILPDSHWVNLGGYQLWCQQGIKW